jgi:hypothetical protein
LRIAPATISSDVAAGEPQPEGKAPDCADTVRQWEMAYSNRRKFGKPDMEATSRKSTCTFAPGEAKRYVKPLDLPVTVIAVGPVYA